MSGYNSGGDDSYFSDEDDIAFNPITKQFEKPASTTLTKQAKPVVFSGPTLQGAAAQELTDAIQHKVDQIIVLIQEHDSKSINNSEKQSVSSTVGHIELSLPELQHEIDALLSEIRKQIIRNVRRSDSGVTQLEHATMAVLLRLNKQLKDTQYGAIIDNFIKTEIVEHSTLLDKGDSRDPLLHYIYENKESANLLGENEQQIIELLKNYIEASDNHFIYNSEGTLRALRILQDSIGTKLEQNVDPKALGLKLALKSAAEQYKTKNEEPPTHKTSHRPE